MSTTENEAISDQGVQNVQTISETSLLQQQHAMPKTVPAGVVLTNVLSARAGARVLFATDEWFAAADNLLNDDDPFFDPSAYCEQGKVMDGWESRRRREAGYDWCVLKLSTRATVYTATVDTAHFTGNHVPAISLHVADLTYEHETAMVAQFPGIVHRLLHGCIRGTGATPLEVAAAEQACVHHTEWTEVLPRTALQPGYEETRWHHFSFAVPLTATHVRLNYYPDGGVARLRLEGLPHPSQPRHATTPLYQPISTGASCTVVSHTRSDVLPSQQQQQQYPFLQISCVDQGGVGVACSNQHYGTPSNLIQVTSGVDMGDGWETARHPNRPSVLVQNEKGLVDSDLSDWCILKLGQPVTSVARIILDTKHFRGNYPESVQVEGCYFVTDDKNDDVIVASPQSAEWLPLLARGRMSPDSEHCFDSAKEQILNAARNVSHVRIRIYPDGGLSRVRVYGEPMA